MNGSLPHILIVEGEYLIALDAEYQIKAAMDCRVSVMRLEQVDEQRDLDLRTVDLCLMDLPLDPSPALRRARRLLDLDVTMLFTTVCESHRAGVAGFEKIPIVMKPYNGDHLRDTVAEATKREGSKTPATRGQN
ncbi:hypothetical protein [Sinorhizobium sp. BG8]|uniref:hypothetical protein n=1 Tax=Sinorhizobium sp. BG8 TaxID=2613773 RepID=UPI00193D7DE4|nr:hypothetical protein [Sinorhizobium sp. BG8]QRM53890.1 hypothetical protein F3Y30_04470 [Sinorhizobium sp. BG8]